MSINENIKSESSNQDFRYKQLQDFAVEVNWRELADLIINYYVESGIGRLQVPVETMIRVYFLQLRYNLNAHEAALALSKIDVLRDFAIIDINTDVLPEAECIDIFRSLVELNGLTMQFAAAFNIQPIRQIINKTKLAFNGNI